MDNEGPYTVALYDGKRLENNEQWRSLYGGKKWSRELLKVEMLANC